MDAEVVVVGAGPTGLMLAGELALCGVDVLLVEQLHEPHGQSRGLGFTARAAETFEQRGLMARFGEVSRAAQGHFGGLPLDFSVLEGGFFAVRGVLQCATEQVLEDWARERGARIRRGVRVTGVDDLGDRVTVRVRNGTGETALTCAYLVGCDGGRSAVRRLAGFDFPGTEPTLEMYLADVRGGQVRPRPLGERVPGGMVMAAPLGDGIDRIIVCERGTRPGDHEGEDVGWDRVAAAWARLTGEDVSGFEALWVSTFTDTARQVTRYRRGRVLLAGDAAHVHLPAGGQGLSTGVQDAANLGWKLAADVLGWAPPGLLDSYDAERRPVGARLLMNTRAQGLLYLTDDSMEPMRALMRELIELPYVARHLAGTVSGLDVRYSAGAPVDAGLHPLLGRRLPHVPLVVDGEVTPAAQLLHRGRGVLLDLGADPAVPGAAEGWQARVDVVAARPVPGGGPLDGTAALLVRPDGYVAWASPGGPSPAGSPADTLADALARWFGTPVPAVTASPTQ